MQPEASTKKNEARDRNRVTRSTATGWSFGPADTNGLQHSIIHFYSHI